jgi:hypothetical protein
MRHESVTATRLAFTDRALLEIGAKFLIDPNSPSLHDRQLEGV